MKRLHFLLTLTLLGCKKDGPDCQELAQPEPRGCPKILAPVCGCNGKTYDNGCIAESYGITNYTPGPCNP